MSQIGNAYKVVRVNNFEIVEHYEKQITLVP